MVHQLLADSVVFAHCAFILFALFGGFLALRWRWIPWLHVPAVTWGGVVEFSGRLCPLTPLENRFRQAAGGEPFHGDFIQHYVVPIVYPADLTREVQLLLGVGLLAVNVLVYASVLRRFARTASR